MGALVAVLLGVAWWQRPVLRKDGTQSVSLEWRSFGLPLNNPDMVDVARAQHMLPNDLVVSVVVAGKARAYPWWLLVGYHVVNDTVAGVPIVVSLCEACSGAAAFTPTVDALPNAALSFHICGIAGGTFETCDVETGSRWHPFRGIAHSGPLAGSKLDRVPVFLAEWGDWSQRHPDTLVANAARSFRERHHGQGPRFEAGHDSSDFKDGSPGDNRLPSNELVYGMHSRDGSSGVALPLVLLERNGGLFRVHFDGRDYAVVKTGRFEVNAYAAEAGELEVKSWRPLRLTDAKGGEWDALGAPTRDSAQRAPLTLGDGYTSEWYEWSWNSPGSRLIESEGKRGQ